MVAVANNHKLGILKKEIHMYSLIVLEVRSLKWLSLGQSQGVENPFLPFLASRAAFLAFHGSWSLPPFLTAP